MLRLQTFLLPLLFRLSNAQPFIEDDTRDTPILTNSYESRARILLHQGNIYFIPGKHKHISFLNSGGQGTITFNNVPLSQIPTQAKVKEYEARVDRMEQTSRVQSILLGELNENYNELESGIYSLRSENAILNSTLQRVNRTMSIALSKAKRNLKTITRRYKKLKRLIRTDECLNNPCENGGTCIDLVGKYKCLCLDSYTGPECSENVNECLLYAGTELGCKNGATCEDTHGSYLCHCAIGFHGVFCDQNTVECTRQSSHALCGPGGTCVPPPSDTPAGEANYKCICDLGYKRNNDRRDPRCIDIDECESSPCHPGVFCINLPGSFRCGSCPAGLTGSGVYCNDLDECAIDNGDCSQSPMVHCINTHGSYSCGPCPPGYEGDGRHCSRVSVCSSNPCFPSASCIEMPESMSSAGFRCQCPHGMVGNGIGNAGCHFTNTTACQSVPCFNGGQCQALTAETYSCHCSYGFAGQRCETPTPCLSAPCQSGGTCVPEQSGTYTCLCTEGTYGDNCELEMDGCNGHYQGLSGSFEFPAQTAPSSVYGNLKLCDWTIATVESKILNITFPSFHLEHSPAYCRYDNLTIFDGETSQGPIVGTYCGWRGRKTAPPPFILTSSNQVFLRFRSDRAVGADGFMVNWTSVDPVCSVSQTEHNGVIRSHNYPNSYPQNEHCRWFLSTEPGKHFKLEISRVTLDSQSENCTNDLLEIKDGARWDDPSLVRFCQNSEAQTMRYTSLPQAIIYFRSDNRTEVEGAGFSITYTAQEVESNCGGTFTESRGTISTPNYNVDSLYFANLDCVWLIDGSAMSPSFVQLEFLDFVEDPAVMVLWSYSTIRHGRDETAPLDRHYCNRGKKPTIVRSKGSQLWMRFHSDDNQNAKGFQLAYKIVCGEVFNSVNGTFQSPNFPDSYGHPVECKYVITAPTRHVIELEFTTIQMKDGIPPGQLTTPEPVERIDCDQNYLILETKLAEVAKPWFHGRKLICGQLHVDKIHTTGGELTVIFKTDGSTENRGFQANFRSWDAGCGGVLYGSHGSFRSPRHDEDDTYMDNLHCRWDIFAPPVNQNIYSIKYCGHTKPPPLLSSTNKLVVRFRSDMSVTMGGFMAQYEAIDSTLDCDRSFVSAADFIQSANYPNKVKRAMECIYHIQVHTSARILLSITNFSLPCAAGYVEIRNGPDAMSPPIMGLPDSKLCGDTYVPDFRSQSGRLYMKFKFYNNYERGYSSSPLPVDFDGAYFQFYYTELNQACGGHMNGISGALSSPQYPYPSSLFYACQWHIAVAEGNLVNFQITLIDKMYDNENTMSCKRYSYRRLEIFDGGDIGVRLLKRFCKRQITAPAILSSSNKLSVRYVQRHGRLPSRGFYAHFSTKCTDIMLKDFHGILHTPGFGQIVSQMRICKWTIRAPPGNQLLLNFHFFQIQDNSDKDCSRNYLEIPEAKLAVTEGKPEGTNETKRFCQKTEIPVAIETTENIATISFRSENEPENHFGLSWTVKGCGGSYRTEGMLLVNKSSGTNERFHLCEWTIVAPVGKRIEFILEYFGLSDSGYCGGFYRPDWTYTTRLIFFDGIDNSTGHPSHRICTSSIVGTIQTRESSSNQMFIQFYYQMPKIIPMATKESNDTILKARFKFKEGGCGRVLEGKDRGTLHSPGYPKAFRAGIECTWRISVAHGHAIVFNVTQFNVQNYLYRGRTQDLGVNNQSCPDPTPKHEGSLILYDGPNNSFPLLRKICHDFEPDQFALIRTTREHLYIEFQGSSDVEDIADKVDGESVMFPDERFATGFLANYATGCGARLLADSQPRVISTVREKDGAEYDECDWMIKPKTSGERIYLHFDFMDLRSYYRHYHGTHFTREQFGNFTDEEYQCSMHKLEIYEGNDVESGVLLDSFCPGCDHEKHQCPSMDFSGQSLFLRLLRPTGYYYMRHFRATYRAGSIVCGGDFYTPEGSISSPAYSGQPMECTWILHSSVGNRIKLEFTTFNVRQSEFCVLDYVEVREISSAGRLLGRFCSEDTPEMQEGWEKLWVKFRIGTDDSELEKDQQRSIGFQATYQLFFGGDPVGNSGQISSPYYGLPGIVTYGTSYDRTTNIWHLTAAEDQVIRLEFVKFNVHTWAGSSENCDYGVKVYDQYCTGSDCGDITPVKSYCGWLSPDAFTSSANVITIAFRSFWYDANKFLLKWEYLPLSTVNATIAPYSDEFNCGGTLTIGLSDGVQTLTSPGYPYGYAGNLKCRWIIKTTEELWSVKATLLDVDLEVHRECRYDYIQLGHRYRDRICDPLQHLSVYDRTYTGRQRDLEILFFSDTSANGTGFKLQYELVCGHDGVIVMPGPGKTITSPGYPQSYDVNVTCRWELYTRTGRGFELEFDALSLEDSVNCTKDYVQANNLQFCSSKLPAAPLFANSRYTRVKFVSDGTIVSKGFKLFVRERVHDCSEDQLILSEQSPRGEISSPGFPGRYSNSLDCTWIVRAPAGRSIQLDVDPKTFHLEHCSSRWVYDFLEVRDGATSASPEIGRYCSRAPPSSIKSSGSMLYIRFKSDHIVSAGGFQAVYKLATCGGILTTTSNGTLRSPNYPDNYPNKQDCDWRIHVPESHFINFSFSELRLQTIWNNNCSQADYVEPRDWNATIDAPGKSFGKFCSTNVVSERRQHTSSNLLDVKFHTDSYGSSKGFKLDFNASKSTCGGEITSQSGVIETMNYPRGMPPSLECSWKFIGKYHQRLKLVFDDIKAHQYYGNNCFVEWELRIHNGIHKATFNYYVEQANYWEKNAGKLCGREECSEGECVKKATWLSSSDEASVVVRSNRYYQPSFKLRYAWLDTSEPNIPWSCSGLITENTTIEIPKQFENTTVLSGSEVLCHYEIVKPQQNMTVVLQISVIGLIPYRRKSPKLCDLEESFKITGRASSLLPLYEVDICNKTLGSNTNFFIALPHSSIDFRYFGSGFPNQRNDSHGFHLEIAFQECGGVLTARQGVITSPNYGKGSYPDFAQCVWNIIAPEGEFIKMKLTDLAIEIHVSCLYDNVTILNGPRIDSPELRAYCGKLENYKPEKRTITSATHQLTVYFVSDRSASHLGFRLEYEFATEGCGFSDHALQGVLTTPEYPSDYPNSQECQWEVFVPSGYRINFTFNAFDLAQSKNCSNDFLLVEQIHRASFAHPNPVTTYWVTTDYEELHSHLCAHEIPEPLITDTNQARLSFESDATLNAKGFNITWRAICGATYRLEHGEVTSPGYPKEYPNTRTDCYYNIIPSYDGLPILVVKIEDVNLISNLNRDGKCSWDYLEIIEMFTNRSLGKFCEPLEPKLVSSTGPVLVHFHTNRTWGSKSDTNLGYRGFRLSYAVSDCGGEISLKEASNHLSSLIQSPAFPLDYHHSLDCVWRITAPEGRIISLKFTNFSLEHHHDCKFDSVQLFDGVDFNDTLLARLCGHEAPQRFYRSSDSFLTIRLLTDAIVARGGFRAVVTASPGPSLGCGGDLRAGTEWSAFDLPRNETSKKYLRALQCEWHIKAEENKVIQTQVLQFDVELAYQEKCFDFMDFMDGYFKESPVLYWGLCGKKPPWEFNTSFNVLYMSFVSDNWIEASGVSLRYRAIDAKCTQTVEVTSETQTIAFDGSQNELDSGHRCRWILTAPEQQRIEITIKDIQWPTTPRDSGCHRSFLEIRDIPRLDEQLIRDCGQYSMTGYQYISIRNKVHVSAALGDADPSSYKFTLEAKLYNDCNRTLTLSISSVGGRLTSVGYPFKYPHNRTCLTEIKPPPAHSITTMFRRFFYAEYSTNNTCNSDYVQVGTLLAAAPKYCGSMLPPPFISEPSKSVKIFTKTDPSMRMSGWWDLTYSFTNKDCGGKIVAPRGVVGVPLNNMYASTYVENRVCEWNVSVARAHEIQLKFTLLSLVSDGNSEAIDDCGTKDRLEIKWKTTTEQSQLFCGNANDLPVLNLMTSSVLIKFSSDSDPENNGRGFRIEFKQERYQSPHMP